VSAMFWTIRDHFGLSLNDAGLHPAKRVMALSTPGTRQGVVVW
jgi:hypothetical protein